MAASVIAGTGGNSTRESVELTRAAICVGADACLLVTPYYNKPTQEGLYRFVVVRRNQRAPWHLQFSPFNFPGGYTRSRAHPGPRPWPPFKGALAGSAPVATRYAFPPLGGLQFFKQTLLRSVQTPCFVPLNGTFVPVSMNTVLRFRYRSTHAFVPF